MRAAATRLPSLLMYQEANFAASKMKEEQV
jgi:hypothetical protein